MVHPHGLARPHQNVVPGIKWIPPEGEARELDWLRNMSDWMISKKRFWGLALPIWCAASASISRWSAAARNCARRPWKAGTRSTAIRRIAPMWTPSDPLREVRRRGTRIEDVGNPWLDAGIVSFSTMATPPIALLGEVVPGRPGA